MELNEFIKQAILEAIKGVEDARTENTQLNAGINERHEIGTLDIEITALIGTNQDKVVNTFGEGKSQMKFKVPVKLGFKES